MKIIRKALLVCGFLKVILGNDKPGCDVGLGLERRLVQDDQISSSLSSSSPEQGRLNNPLSAWCFEWSKLNNSVTGRSQEIFWQVDLLTPTLVSGFRSQGPPRSLHDVSYISYISLTVEVSVDGRLWEDCCGDSLTSFYLDDKKEEAGVIQTNSFGDLVPARFVRIRVSTSLRWVGHDHKCFRFEVLGCQETSEARSELRAEASTHGYLSVSWTSPNVSLAASEGDEDTLTLDSRYYSLAVAREDTGAEVTYNTSDHSLIHPSPVYGAVYRLRLTCFYHHLAIPCGQLEVVARPRVSLSCQAHSSFCDPATELVTWRLPQRLTASYLGNGSMLVEWVNTDTGWVSEVVSVRLKDDRGVTILDQEIAANRYKMLVSGLAEAGARQHGINFIPSGPGVPTDGGGASASITVLQHAGVGYGFVSLVGLRASVLYHEGGLRLGWQRAVARAVVGGQLRLRTAAEYLVTLRSPGGDVLRNLTLEGSVTSHDLRGVSLGAVYTVTLSCVFLRDAEHRVTLPCGSVTLVTSPPDLLEADKVLRRLGVARSWAGSEAQCLGGGGHLVSLGRDLRTEELIQQRLGLSDWWTGGNICPDSPAPQHSMWTDGAINTVTNFALNSELEGDKCCVKAGGRGWRGEKCDGILYGVCQYSVDLARVLSPPRVVLTPGHGSIHLSLDTCDTCPGWRPSRVSLSACLKRSLEEGSEYLDSRGNCVKAETGVSSWDSDVITIGNLSMFSEYEIEIDFNLEFFNATSLSRVQGRTMPERSIAWVVASSGQLRVVWAERKAFFGEHNPVRLDWRTERDGEAGSVRGSAASVSLTSLRLGGRYMVTLTDLQTNVSDSFNFTAYPNCRKGKMVGLNCVFLTRPLPYSRAEAECAKDEFQLWSSDKQNITLETDQIFNGTNRYWILNAGYAAGDSTCLAQAGSEQRSQHCDTELGALCVLPSPLTFPSLADFVRITPELDGVSFEKFQTSSGWKVDYSVDMWPSNSLHRKPRTSVQVVADPGAGRPSYRLEAATPYTAEIRASLGAGVTRNFTIPNIVAGKEVNMAAYQATLAILPSEVILALLIITTINIFIIGVSISVFLASQTCCLYSDNVAQICFQVSLICVFITTIVSYFSVVCEVIMALNVYFYLASFMFLLLESLIILHKLVDKIILPLLENTVFVILAGFLPPLVYTGLTLPWVAGQVTVQDSVCAINLASPAASLSLVPASVISCLSLGLLVTSIIMADDSGRRPISAEVFSRAKTLRKTRYSVMLLLVSLYITWLFSMFTSFFKEFWMSIALMVASLSLATFILTLRGFFDYQVVNRIKRAYLKNKVGNTVYEDSREIPSRKTTYSSPKSHKKSLAVTPNPDPLSEGDEYL